MLQILKIRTMTFKVWINEHPPIYPSIDMTQTSTLESQRSILWDVNKMAIEVYRPQNHSYYALLGLDVLPAKENLVTLDFHSSLNGEVLEMDTLSVNPERVYSGIDNDYLEAIQTSSINFLKTLDELPHAHLTFSIGAHCEIGSSPKLFSELTKLLLDLCFQNKTAYSLSDIEHTVNKYF